MNTKRPVYGWLSVSMPFAAILALAVGEAFLNAFVFVKDQPDWPLIIFVLLLSPVAGVVFGISGIVRRERLRWLSITGLVLNIGVVFTIQPPTY